MYFVFMIYFSDILENNLKQHDKFHSIFQRKLYLI